MGQLKGWAQACVGKAKLAAAALVLFPVFTAAEAQTLASLPSAPFGLERTGPAKPVFAWVRFCDQFPVECEVDTAEPEFVTLSSQTWGAITTVNRSVNRRIKPLTDKEHWGVVDRWEFPEDGRGDCEDYQLLKRKLLVEKGLPRRAMRMTVVIDEIGEGHAVLMIRTDRGDFILDNKTSAVLPWDQTGYIFVKREGHDGMAWISLGGQHASPTTTANR